MNISDVNLGEYVMMESTRRANEALNIFRRWSIVTYDDVEDYITVGVRGADAERLLKLVREERTKGTPSPAAIPNLDVELRLAIFRTFQTVDMVGGISALGSMVFRRDLGPKSWRIYNPGVLTANYDEGNFGRVSGRPRKGKTNLFCVLMERWAEDGNVVFSNVLPNTIKGLGPERLEEPVPWGPDDRCVYVRHAKALFKGIADLGKDERWLFGLDEGGLIYSKPDAATRRAKDLDKLVRVLGKLHGSMVIIEQRPESVPTILQEFSSSSYFCEEPGIVDIELKGPRLEFHERVKDFPRTSLPFDTYDIAYWSLNVNVASIFAALSGTADPKETLRAFMSKAPVEIANVKNCVVCGTSLGAKRHPRAKYCSDKCRTAAYEARQRGEENLVDPDDPDLIAASSSSSSL